MSRIYTRHMRRLPQARDGRLRHPGLRAPQSDSQLQPLRIGLMPPLRGLLSSARGDAAPGEAADGAAAARKRRGVCCGLRVRHRRRLRGVRVGRRGLRRVQRQGHVRRRRGGEWMQRCEQDPREAGVGLLASGAGFTAAPFRSGADAAPSGGAPAPPGPLRLRRWGGDRPPVDTSRGT